MIIGNLTRDPEMRYTPSGQAVASFTIATNRTWVDQSGAKQEAAEFHDIVAWGKLAEICNQILKKGYKVFVEGRLQTRSWESQDGTKRNKTEIVAENMMLLSRPRGEEAPPEPSTPAQEEGQEEGKENLSIPPKNKIEETEEINLDDIPF